MPRDPGSLSIPVIGWSEIKPWIEKKILTSKSSMSTDTRAPMIEEEPLSLGFAVSLFRNLHGTKLVS